MHFSPPSETRARVLGYPLPILDVPPPLVRTKRVRVSYDRRNESPFPAY